MGFAHCGCYRRKAGVRSGAITAASPSYTTPQLRPVASCACMSLPFNTPDDCDMMTPRGSWRRVFTASLACCYNTSATRSSKRGTVCTNVESAVAFSGFDPDEECKRPVDCRAKPAPLAGSNLDRTPLASALLGVSLAGRPHRLGSQNSAFSSLKSSNIRGHYYWHENGSH